MVKSSFFLRQNTTIVMLLLALTFAVSPKLIKSQSRSERTSETTTSRSLALKDRVEVFEEVWKAINEKYYDPKFNGTDWNAIREHYRPLVESAVSDEGFYDLLSQMVGELRDAHTRIRSPRQRQERKNNQATSAGVRLFEVEGKPVVFSVTPNSEAARAGVTEGMIVQTVNGQPISKALSEARREVGTSSSERATRLLSYSRLLAGEPDTPLKLGLLRADGTSFDATLTRHTVSAAPQLISNLLLSGYAYIKFNRFMPPIDKQIKEALTKLKDAPAMILDLRTNGGGDGEIGLKIAGYFFNEKISFANIITRSGKPPSAFFGLVRLPKEFKAGKKGGQLYSNPVVILINEATGSTSELFASAMQEQNRARIIGTQSCGCVLGVLNHKELKGGGELSISEIGFVTSKGRTLEGKGVVPDYPIAVTVVDLQSQHDAALEEAQTYLNNLLKRK